MNTSNGHPRHVAIIMDGNGRWAEHRGLPRIDGHRAGVRNVRPVIEELNRHGVSHVTLYTFSTENWKRPEEEVSGLMELLRSVIRSEARKYHKDNVVIHHIGDVSTLSDDLQKSIKRVVKKTEKNTGLNLIMAFNYGGRAEIIRAIKSIVAQGTPPEDIDETLLERHLYTAGMPEVDLVIRTSGEYRTSNFLIWQAAYAEYYFTPVLWPDFDKQEVDNALQAYSLRKRRFGGLLPEDEC